MKRQLLTLLLLVASTMLVGQACATKKYVRKTLDERVAPLEGRTAELEQSVARNTSAIKEVDERLSRKIDTVSSRVDEVDRTAKEADNKATEAQAGVVKTNERISTTEKNIDTYAQVKLAKVYFKTSRFDLTPEAKAELDTLASAAKGRDGIRIEIAGYADKRGGVRQNEVLTNNRAEAVKRYLFNAHGLPVRIMEYIGAGKISEGGRSRQELQENRRVDVTLWENKVVHSSTGS